jgi:hypothetical protein
VRRSQDADVERIAKRALGTRATLVRALRRRAAPVQPAQGVAHVATDEVTTDPPSNSSVLLC